MSWWPTVRRAERRSTPLWVWPTVAGLAGLIGGLTLTRLRLPDYLQWLAWPGDADSAVSLLQTVAASVITVTVLTFTLTLVALQLASQQFSPRLLRNFTRDPVIRVVLSVLMVTLVFAAAVTREVNEQKPLPDLALLVAQLLGACSVGAVLVFIAHLVRNLRVDRMMVVVHDETLGAIGEFYPRYDEGPRPEPHLPPDATGDSVRAASSGFVRLVDVEGLVRTARRHDWLVRLEVRPGDHLVRGSPLATVWGAPADEASDAINGGVRLGFERTVEQDAAFGFRQLTDIAVKAISPGINDPVTAAHAIGHLAALLVEIMGRRLGPTLHTDDDATRRVLVPDRDLRYYLDLVCGPIRHYGRADATVLMALLRMLRDAAAVSRDHEQRAELERQTRLVEVEPIDQLRDDDAERVRAMASRVRQALAGDVRGAYLDRSGETRSV